MIDDLIFATWSDADKKYVSGTIKKDLTIALVDKNGRKETWRINNNGKIELIKKR